MLHGLESLELVCEIQDSPPIKKVKYIDKYRLTNPF